MVKYYTPSSGQVSTTAPQVSGGQTTTSNGNPPPEYFDKVIQNDIFTTGGKNISQISNIKDALYPPAVLEKQKDAEAKKSEVTSLSNNLLDLLSKKGTMDAKQYEDTKNSLASQLVIKMKEAANMGASLTSTELGIMAGEAPIIQQKGPSVFSKIGQFFTGNVPVQTGQVVDPDQQLINKLNIISGKSPTNFPTVGNTNALQTPQQQPNGVNAPSQAKNATDWLGGLLGNFSNEATGMIKGLPAMGKQLLQMTPVDPLMQLLEGTPANQVDMLRPAKTAIGMGASIVDSLGKTVGVTKDATGNISWSPQAAYEHAYERPIETAMWILPFLKGAKGAGAVEGATEGAVKDAGIFEQAASDLSKADKASKAARGVATIYPESVVKSGEIMGKALQYAPEAKSIEGMAIDLEKSIPVQGKVIDSFAKSIDKTIGPQPIDDIVSQVMNKVGNSTSARANPELLKVVEDTLRKQLSEGELPGGFAKGNAEATTMTAINNARKYFTSGKDSWFRNGTPVGSPTNDLNALEWQAANGLKDVIAESDIKGIVKDALDRQHVAYETVPSLSKLASKAGTKIGALGYKWGLLRKAWETTGGKIVEEAKISNARKLQGPAPIPGAETVAPELMLPAEKTNVMNLIKQRAGIKEPIASEVATSPLQSVLKKKVAKVDSNVSQAGLYDQTKQIEQARSQNFETWGDSVLKDLNKAGIKPDKNGFVELYRGTPSGNVDRNIAPTSSFSASPETAKQYGKVNKFKVNIKDLFGSGGGGFEGGVFTNRFELVKNGDVYVPKGSSINVAKTQESPSSLPQSSISPEGKSLVAQQPLSRLPQATKARKAPLPADIIENMLKKKGPAQAARLIKDMGYKPGSQQFRSLQEMILNAASKRRYK